MDLIQAIVLALLQGLTEFLPVSSSAHLILATWFTGWTDQGLDFDIVIHGGTLTAVVFHFRHQLLAMTRDWFASLGGRELSANARLAWWIIVATIPVVVAGFLLKELVETTLRDPRWIAGGLIVFGLLLGWADWRHRGERDESSLTLKDALVIGFAQALALIPGTSRSGITMTAALFLGLNRESAARFSFLLSIPVILGALTLAMRDLGTTGLQADLAVLGAAFAVAAVAAWVCIRLFLAFIQRIGMQPFVVYRVVLGVVILSVIA